LSLYHKPPPPPHALNLASGLLNQYVKGFTTLETRRIRADKIEVYKILNWLEGMESGSIFMKRVGNFSGDSQKLFKMRRRLDVGNIASATEFVMYKIACRVR